jgi:hypothetical protein
MLKLHQLKIKGDKMNLTLKERLIQILEDNIDGMNKSEAIRYITSAHPEKGFVYPLEDEYECNKIFREYFEDILKEIAERYKCNPYLTAQEMVWYCWDTLILGNVSLIEDLFEGYEENERF